MANSTSSLYLGFDLSTQQLKAIVVDSDLKVMGQAKVEFDSDFAPKYGIQKGVHVHSSTGEVYAPVAMWMESLDLVLSRLSQTGVPMNRIHGVSGSGQQHGSVWLNAKADSLLRGMDPNKGSLLEQLKDSLSNEFAPNWQDHSTQEEYDAFHAELGSRQRLADVTGSSAYHRFTGLQIMRQRRRNPDIYARTCRIALVSSWLASVMLGKLAPLDISDVCGMNLWDIRKNKYSEELLLLAAGRRKEDADELRAKLGEPCMDGGASFGRISSYFVKKYNFYPDCQIISFTGDNPATILALPLRPHDAIVSLGTSTTLLMNTPAYQPDGSCHFFNHPTTAGQYMFMLCYKNGGLAREKIRDQLPKSCDTKSGATTWDNFNRVIFDTEPLDISMDTKRAKIGVYFPLRETAPNIRAGTWRFTCNAADGSDLKAETKPWPKEIDSRIIIESQALSMRLRSQNLVKSLDGILPAQPRRIYVVGGGSVNPALASVIGDVLGGTDGIYKLDMGGNACAIGGAYKALWALERKKDEKFEDLIGKRWKEEGAIKKIHEGFKDGIYQKYGNVLGAFRDMENQLLRQETK